MSFFLRRAKVIISKMGVIILHGKTREENVIRRNKHCSCRQENLMVFIYKRKMQYIRLKKTSLPLNVSSFIRFCCGVVFFFFFMFQSTYILETNYVQLSLDIKWLVFTPNSTIRIKCSSYTYQYIDSFLSTHIHKSNN